MKRLVPFLILAAFCLCGLRVRVLGLHRHLQKSAASPSGPLLSVSSASDEFSDDLADAEPFLAPCRDFASSPKPRGQALSAPTNPTTQSKDHYHGLSCGGLPA